MVNIPRIHVQVQRPSWKIGLSAAQMVDNISNREKYLRCAFLPNSQILLAFVLHSKWVMFRIRPWSWRTAALLDYYMHHQFYICDASPFSFGRLELPNTPECYWFVQIYVIPIEFIVMTGINALLWCHNNASDGREDGSIESNIWWWQIAIINYYQL